MASIRGWGRSAAAAALLVMLADAQDAPDASNPAEKGAGELAKVGIRFEGLLPGSVDPELAGVFPVEFRLYRAPQGGEALWRESLDVRVVDGRMDVTLGERSPIPWELHEATFKFLGAAVAGGPEVYPRFAVVNVVFVSPDEGLLARAEAAREEGREYARARRTVEAGPRPAATWREALAAARAAGGDLADYEDWYRAMAGREEAAAGDWTGHYEWVLPWVYDPASHGRYSRYFRGRFQGCDYDDLSPRREYVWRLSRPLVRSAESAEEGA